MAGTPLFLITNVGLNAANHANPQGPFIHIIYFQIGSAYGYQPQPTDTGLNGTILYQSAPSSYTNIGNNTINIICEIPPEAGPFDFGEVGLFADDGTGTGYLFAKAVFDTPQTKFSSLGTNVVSSYTLNCLLKLQQSTAIFQIDTTTGPPAVFEIYQWSDVFPPGVSANPDIPLYLVRELSEYGDSTILQNTNDSEWTVGTTYGQYSTNVANGNGAATFTVVNSTTSWVQIAASQCHPRDLTAANRQFVLETHDGFFRSVSSVVTSGSNYQFNLNVTNDGTYNNSPLQTAPAIGSQVKLLRDNQRGGSVYYSQIVDPPAVNLATNGVPGLAYGANGLYMPSPGVIEAFGLLHSPSTSTGRVLTSSDDLNNLSLPSGMYTTQSGSSGFPNAMPVPWDGNIWIQNFGDMTELYLPATTGGGDAAGNGGYPMYYRAWTGAQWTSWFPLKMTGKQGAGSLTVNVSGVSAIAAGGTVPTPTAPGIIFVTCDNDGNSGTRQQLIINGTIVCYASKGGGGGFGRNPLLAGAFNAGATIQFTATNGAGATYTIATWSVS